MPVNQSLLNAETKPFKNSFYLTIAAAVALTAFAGAIALTRYQMNTEVKKGEKARVLASLGSLQLDARKKLEIIAQSEEKLKTLSKLGEDTSDDASGFHKLMLVNLPNVTGRQSAALVRAIEPLLASMDLDRQNDITGSIDTIKLETTNFVTVEADVYSVEAVPVVVMEKPFALIGIQRVDESMLATLATQAGTGPLHIQNARDAEESNSVVALGGALESFDGPALVWHSERPGDLLMMRWMLILAGGAICIAGMLIWHARNAMLQLRRSEERARKLAGYDILSGLPNRFLFTQLLDQEFARAARGGGAFALMYFDLDRFREINDLLGHDTGDSVIVGVTARLKSILRTGDHLGRFGSDEFAILQTAISGPQDCEELASRVMEAVRDPINIGEQHITVRLSGGIALHPQDAANRQDLMREADEALSRAKSEGRNRYTFFQKQLSEALRSRKTTEDELRKAIEHSGLTVYYQPIMTVDGKRMACVEALVRWPHPVRGLVPPDNFIGLAEDRGLILPLGEFVLRQACRDGKRWPGVRVAVNVSPIQFRQADFAAMVERILIEEEFEPTRLELELTEGVVIADADQAENVMMDLRALGVRLALDDFGTGYSSLVYLRRFAFDKIKIDRSFLESMEGTGESAIIVHSIIHLGRALGLTVTAEGIETSEQHRFLQAAGAHELQGYLFSRPVPAAEIDVLLAAQNAADSLESGEALRSVA